MELLSYAHIQFYSATLDILTRRKAAYFLVCGYALMQVEYLCWLDSNIDAKSTLDEVAVSDKLEQFRSYVNVFRV